MSALAAVLSLGTGHAATEKPIPPAEDPEGVIRLHAVNSAKLREIMQTLHHWREQNTAQELQTAEPDPALLDHLLEQVEELMYHAELMSMGMPFTDLSRTELQIFRALGGELYTQALQLKQQVSNRQYGRLEQTYDQLDRTCHACHQLFRRN